METVDIRRKTTLDFIDNILIVSCQVEDDVPFYTNNVLVKMDELPETVGSIVFKDGFTTKHFVDLLGDYEDDWYDTKKVKQ